jgi:outer membrane receptor protein involved in Fe transport
MSTLQYRSATPARLFHAVLELIVFGALLSTVAWAQNATGRLVGKVTDSQGAALPAVKVSAINADTNRRWETTSDQTGGYQILDVPIGRYSLVVERDGFAKAVTEIQSLDINQSLRWDIALKVGSVSEQVKVTAEAALVETVNPTLGGTVSGEPVQNLPLNGRNALDLALTQPGVIPVIETTFTAGSFTVAGGRPDAVTFLLDGGINNAVIDNNVNFNPNPDTIAEFRVLQNSYTAEYGRNGGGIISVVTKSGTNQLHGSVFDYLRNDAFNANTYFGKLNGQARPALKRNQFGGTFGGPALKNRLFYFFGYQGQRQAATQSGSGVSTFTARELGGDFSQSSNGQPDAGVAAFLLAHPYYQADASLASNAIVDPNRIDSVAKKYISNGLIPTSSTGVIYPQGRATDNRDEFTEKTDWKVTEKDHITLTLGSNHRPTEYPFMDDRSVPNVGGFPGANEYDSYFGNVAYTRIFTANLLNDFHFTAQRYFRKLNYTQRTLPTANDLGITTKSDDPTGPPVITFASGLGIGFNLNGPAHFADNTYNFADSLTWVKRKHTLKAGGSVVVIQNNATYDYDTNGEFDFYGSASGNDHADFLFGAPDDFFQYPRDGSLIRSKQYGIYAQDEWRLSPRLTLTAGVRYEYTTPKTDPQGRLWSIVPGVQSTRFVNAPLGLVFPGDKGSPSGSNFSDKNDWAPRVGFAWDPFGNGLTSVRGGYGLYYDVLRGEDNNYAQGAPPFYSSAFLSFDPLAVPAQQSSNYLSHPYDATGQIDPFPSVAPTKDVAFYDEFGTGYSTVNPYLRTPYIHQFNLSIQHQLNKSLVGEVSYAGNSSHKLTAMKDKNPTILGTSKRVLNTQGGLTNSDAFGVLRYSIDNAAGANYNAFLASLTKREGDWHSLGSVSFTLAYTYSRNIDNASGYLETSSDVPAYNPRQFRAASDFDVKQRIVLSGGWELPFEHAWQDGPKLLTKGWSLYPIFSAQSGFPLSVNAGLPGSFNTALPGPSGAGDVWLVQANLNAKKVPILDPHKSTNHSYFDTSVLSSPTLVSDPAAVGFIPDASSRTYGTLPRNSFRGPGRVNFDLALEKSVSLQDRVKIGLRLEAFNALNHTEWANPDTSSLQSGTLGQVTSTYEPRIVQLALRTSF